MSSPLPLQVKRPAPRAASVAPAASPAQDNPFAVPVRLADNPFLTPAQGMPAFEPVRIAKAERVDTNDIEIDVSVTEEAPRVPTFRPPRPSMLMRPEATSAPAIPNDPVLIRKMQHTIIERRRGLRRYVVGAMAACAALCTLGVAAWALGGEGEASAASKPSSASVATSTKAHPLVTKAAALETSDVQSVIKKPRKSATAPGKRR